MTMRIIRELRRAASSIQKKFARGALILLYHRVVELESDPQWLCVTPQHFNEQLEVIRKGYHPMRLEHLMTALREGSIPERAVVITFDDGYADNLYGAKPWLEYWDIPATVYVTSGAIGSRREFWWDELERVFLQPGSLPGELSLSISERSYRWTLNGDAHYTEERFRQYSPWNVQAEHDPSARHHLYRSLCQLLRSLPNGARQEALEKIREWAGSQPMSRSTHRPLSPDEVVQLAQGGLIDVGAHTVTHARLAALPLAAQREEIQGSKAHLEDIVGYPIYRFAYPYGTRSDYTRKTVALVREAGFTQACSNFPGKVRRGNDSFQLPRFLIRNWDGDEFARLLGEWCDG